MATQLSDRQLAVIVDRYAATSAELETRLKTTVAAAYVGIDFYDTTQTLAAANTAGDRVTRGMAQATGLSESWANLVLDLLGVKRGRRRATTTRNYPRGIDPAAVYARPIFTYRDAVAYGQDFKTAYAEAMARVDALVATDLALAQREAEHEQYVAAKVTHYRRVIRPELSAGGTCGLCIAASQMIYNIGELLPLHSRCKCKTMPIVGTRDPARVLNENDLADLYNTAGGTSAADLKRTRYQVDENGELGPTLTPQRSTNTKRRTATSQQRHLREGWDTTERIRAELDALEPVLASLEERAAAGENVAGPLNYQRTRIAALKRQLAA